MLSTGLHLPGEHVNTLGFGKMKKHTCTSKVGVAIPQNLGPAFGGGVRGRGSIGARVLVSYTV